MSDTDSPRLPVRSRTDLSAFLAGWLTVGCLVLFIGCQPSDPSPGPNGSGSGDETDRGTRAECQSLLDSVYASSHPDRLGFTGTVDRISDDLTKWLDTCGDPPALSETAVERLESFPVDGTLDAVRAERFTPADVNHLRNALMLRMATAQWSDSADGDLTRVTAIFERICDQIQRIEPTADDPALAPFPLLMFGRGTDRDRAWVFAEAVRQLRLHAVIVRAGTDSESDDSSGEWLVGLPLDGACYLFSPRVGRALRSPNDANRPATLAELTAEPEFFTPLWEPGTKPDWSEPTIELIGHAGWWAPRMAALESELTGERAVVLADLLGETDDAETDPSGAIAMIRSRGPADWKTLDLELWPYPQRQRVAFLDETANDPEFQAEMRIWELPRVPSTKVTDTMVPTYLLRNARLNQLGVPVGRTWEEYQRRMRTERQSAAGRREELRESAIQNFQTVRTEADRTREFLSQTELDLIDRAVQDADFWIGSIELERGELSGAIATFRQYDQRYGERGDWADAVLLQLAEAYRLQDRSDRAIKTLEIIPEESPQFPPARETIRRLEDSVP